MYKLGDEVIVINFPKNVRLNQQAGWLKKDIRKFKNYISKKGKIADIDFDDPTLPLEVNLGYEIGYAWYAYEDVVPNSDLARLLYGN